MLNDIESIDFLSTMALSLFQHHCIQLNSEWMEVVLVQQTRKRNGKRKKVKRSFYLENKSTESMMKMFKAKVVMANDAKQFGGFFYSCFLIVSCISF
jgi:hypothetical protein